MHEGSYEELGAAYKALLDGAAERKLIPQGPSREIYLKGPGAISGETRRTTGQN